MNLLKIALCLCLGTGSLIGQSGTWFPAWEQRSQWDVDSLSWDLVQSIYYQRQADGQPLEVYQDNTTGLDSRFQYTYSSSGKVVETLWETGFDPNWDSYVRDTFLYDGLDSLVEKVTLLWQNGQWDTLSGTRWDYQYSAGQLTDLFLEEYSQGWEPQRWTGYQYSAVGEWDTIQLYAWSGGQWAPTGRIVDLVWEDFGQRKFRSYTQQIVPSGTFENFLRQEFEYPGNKDQNTYTLRWSGAFWDSTAVEFLRYDSIGNLTLKETFSYPSGSRELSQGFRYLHEYGNGDTLLRTVEQQYQLTAYVNFLETIYPGYLPTSRPAPNQILRGLTVYPNPSSGAVHIAVEVERPGSLEFELFDLLGRKKGNFHFSVVSGKNLLDLPTLLSPGHYVYRIQTREGTGTGQLLVD